MNKTARRQGWVHTTSRLGGHQFRIHKPTEFTIGKSAGVWHYEVGRTRHFYDIVRAMQGALSTFLWVPIPRYPSLRAESIAQAVGLKKLREVQMKRTMDALGNSVIDGHIKKVLQARFDDLYRSDEASRTKETDVTLLVDGKEIWSGVAELGPHEAVLCDSEGTLEYHGFQGEFYATFDLKDKDDASEADTKDDSVDREPGKPDSGRD